MNSSCLFPVEAVVKKLLPLVLFSILVAQSVAIADTTYGPVRAGETLSSIVNENYLVSPFSDQKIMQEIFRSNPDAFIYNKMGLLKQGVTLILPSDKSIAASSGSVSVSPRQAQVISLQNREEIESLESKLTSVRAERDRVKDKLRQLEAETINLTAKVAKLESSNVLLSKELKAADEVLKAAQSALEKTKVKEGLSLTQSNIDTTATEDLSRVINQRDEQIKSLEISITELQNKHANELLSLKTSLQGKEAEQLALEDKVKVLTDHVETSESQIAELKKKNESLVVELAESNANYDELLSSKSTASSEIHGKPVSGNQSVQTANEPFDISLVNAQNISSQLKKSVTFPLWAALLGALALALTTFLMLLGRRRTKVAGETEVNKSSATTDDVVFRTADPEKIEPDIESLRVPPRLDPSRVAILDPTMNETSDVFDQPDVLGDSFHKTEHQIREVDLKLAMAETYGELGDIQAANELLAEIQQEGSQKQLSSAQVLSSRLIG